MKYIYFLLLLLSSNGKAQLSKLKPGNLKPGFISVTRFDNERPVVAEQAVKDKGRIIQINIWYPSSGNGTSLCFADYAGLAGLELNASTTGRNWKQDGADKYFAWPASLKADKKTFMTFLNQRASMAAYRDASWNKQKYPLVMLVHGFAADYAYLAEYLACNGYVVMQVPVKGSATAELDYEEKGLEAQVLDYEFALKILNKEFPYFTNSMAVVGFSFGGQSAVALALRNSNIKSIISLDGGIGSAFGAALLRKQTYYKAQNITAPMLHLYNPKDSYTDLSWFNTITKSKRFLAGIKNMEHGYFTSFGLLYKVVPGIMGKQSPDPGNAYETVMLLTKEFLERSLKNKNALNNNFFEEQAEKYPWLKACMETMEVKSAGS